MSFVLPVIVVFCLSVLIGAILIFCPFIPSTYNPDLPAISIDRKDPQWNPNNLTDYGKNMFYAGLGLFFIPIGIVIIGTFAFKKKFKA